VSEVVVNLCLYRVIQSSSTVLKEVVGEIIGTENVVLFTDSPLFPTYNVFALMALLFLFVDFYKIETVRFNTCKLSILIITLSTPF
jgi:hypothetical protein